MARENVTKALKEDENNSSQGFQEFARRKLYDMFINNLPIESLADLPPNYVYFPFFLSFSLTFLSLTLTLSHSLCLVFQQEL